MSVADTLEFDTERVRAQGAADTRPEPGLFTFDWDATKASAQQAYWDTPGRARDTRNADILTAAAALTELNGQSMRRYQIIPVGEPGGVPIANETQFWSDLAQLRRSRPDALTDFAKDRGDYDQKLTARFQRGAADRAQRMSRSGLLGNLAGGIAGSFTDPFTVATLPLGGWGSSAAMRIATEALTQGGIQAAQTPLLAMERRTQGGELTAKEAAWYIGLGALGGAAFKGAEIGLPKAFSAGGRAIAAGDRAVLDRLPPDVAAAIALRRAVPDHAMTPDQAAALHVITRGAQVDATSPLTHTYEGLEAHAARIDQTIADMAQWPRPASTPAYTRPRAPSAAPQGMAPDFDNAWRAIIGNEGGTNRDGSFRTSRAGAIGPAQVMPDTAPVAARLAGLPWDEARYRSDHAYNEALGQAYYREMLRQFDGDPVKAAAAYNAGPGSSRKGTGVRGAMARAQRAGVPDEWVSFLPGETRGYVANFRRRTGMDASARIDAGDGGGLDVDGAASVRPAALDAERPGVEMPTLDRSQFRSDAEFQRAQGEVDAEAMGKGPGVARQAVWSDARDRLLADRGGEVPGALWHPAIGAIDVKWGNSKGGLGKIAEKHPEVLENLPALLESMGVKSRTENRVVLQSLDHKAVVRLDYDGQAQAWLLSAYQVKGKASPSAEYRGVDGGVQDRSPALEAEADIAPIPHEDKKWAPAALSSIEERRAALIELQGERQRLQPDHDGSLTMGGPYPDRARELGFHPLTEREISEWLAELDGQAARWRAVDGPAARDEFEAGGGGPAVVDIEAGKAFDDPAGAGVAQAADSAWHDVQATQAVERAAGDAIDRADAALRQIDPAVAAALDRDIAALGRGLPEQMTFDLGDGRGERSFADIEAEMKADADAIDTIEACMKPGPMGGAA